MEAWEKLYMEARALNRDLIVANHQLVDLTNDMVRQSKERENYIDYLEGIIAKHGWNPVKESK